MSRENSAYVADDTLPSAPPIFGKRHVRLLKRTRRTGIYSSQQAIEISSEARRIDAEQDNGESWIPPVYTKQTIITVQPPQGVTGVNKSSRRPIPVNTAGWVSTPRNQLNALIGTDFLLGVEQLEIQQTVELSTLLGESKPGNTYRIKVPRAETIFLATEESFQYQREILGSSRGFTLTLMDPTGQVAFKFKKGISWGCLPGFLHKMTIECLEPIGSIKQRYTLLGPRFTVYDASKKALCDIYGPNVCCCCMNNDAQFQIVSIDGTHQIASLIHQWNHALVDYTLTLTVPSDTNATLKSLLLGAAFLMEYLYFERLKNWNRR